MLSPTSRDSVAKKIEKSPLTITHHKETGYLTVYMGDKPVFDIEFSHSVFQKDNQKALDLVQNIIETVNGHVQGACDSPLPPV